MRFKHVTGIVVLVVGLAACASEPYVNRPWELDRDHGDFPGGPPIADGTQVTVCYAKSEASTERVRELARQECAKGGLLARFDEQLYDSCPLAAPVSAVFTCFETDEQRRQRLEAEAEKEGNVRPRFQDTGRPAPNLGPARMPVPQSGIGAADVSTTAKSQPFPTFLFNNGSQQQ